LGPSEAGQGARFPSHLPALAHGLAQRKAAAGALPLPLCRVDHTLSRCHQGPTCHCRRLRVGVKPSPTQASPSSIPRFVGSSHHISSGSPYISKAQAAATPFSHLARSRRSYSEPELREILSSAAPSRTSSSR
jgi:hypothetical protein